MSYTNNKFMPKRGAYHRRATEVKTHYANERRDCNRYSESGEIQRKWVSLAGAQTSPEPKLINIIELPSPEQVRREIVIGITRGAIQLDAKFQARIIVADAIARGLIKEEQ